MKPQKLTDVMWCQTVLKVILPVARPGIATASIFTFLLSYNEYLFALILTQKNAMTLPVAIGQYGAEDLSYWTLYPGGCCEYNHTDLSCDDLPSKIPGQRNGRGSSEGMIANKGGKIWLIKTA